MTGDDVDLSREGKLLAEVFSVCLETFDSIDGKDRCNLYGTVKVDDCILHAYDYEDSSNFEEIEGRIIYDRKREDYESIKPGEILTLTGPFPCIEACDPFYLILALWNYDNNEQLICGEITWMDSGTYVHTTNKLLSEKIDGVGCSFIVKYAVFDNAVQALLEVKLINGHGKRPAKVCGSLWAQDNLLKEEILLFREIEPIDLPSTSSVAGQHSVERLLSVGLLPPPAQPAQPKGRPGKLIPLLRSVVAASLDSNLTIWADLSSEYGKIAYGSVNFTPQLFGTSTFILTGDYGEVEVKVTWIDA